MTESVVEGKAMSQADHQIVFFDGYCGLCSRWVDFLIKRDRKDIFRYSPLQGETAKGRFEGLTDEELMRSIWLQDQKGLHSKSTAVLRMFKGLPWLWPVLSVFLIVPKPIRDQCYLFCARNRYKFFPRQDTCRIPTPAERAKFLP